MEENKRRPLVSGGVYWNKHDQGRKIENVFKKGNLKLVKWTSIEENGEGTSIAQIFYDWIEGNYNDGLRRKKRK